MATLGIQVFADAKEVLMDEPLQVMAVTISGSSSNSAAIIGSGKQIRHCRLFADADCYVLWGDDPTAVDFSDSIPLGAENPEVIGIKAGQFIAVIERV